ncbi:MAG: FixG Ig-like domain-containing protein, partial [Candidatus Thermoplasmatota archaeon]
LNATSQNGTQTDEDVMRVTYDHTGSEVIVTAPGDTIETAPGTYTYNFDVENNGSADDTYDLAVYSSIADWTASVQANVTVAAGTTETVSVSVTIPEDAADGEFSDITLNATSQNGTQTDEDVMRVTYDHTGSEVIVRAPGNKTESSPGTYTYNFEVENNGSADDTYDLTVNSSNANWTVSAPANLTVMAGTIETVSVEVTIPQGAEDGNSSDITLTASSQNGTQTHGDVMTVTYEEYLLTVQNPANGTIYIEGVEVTGTHDNFTYPRGYEVDIEAVSNLHYHFIEWTGENGTIADTTANETTIEMLDNYTIMAEFEINTHTLTINSTAGGNVTLPGKGTFTYNATEVVDLEAVADEGYHFTEWIGDNGTVDNTRFNSTTIDILGNYTLTAEFAIKDYNLTINSTAGGNVKVPGEGTFGYSKGYLMDLEAVAAEGYHFVEWTGENSTITDPTANRTTIEMLDNYTITAEFAINAYTLNISSTAGGDVVDPGEGVFEYDHGTVVDLEAMPKEVYRFVEWTGDTGTIDDPTVNQTTIEMLDNYTINAEFAITTRSLTIASTEGGNVIEPGEGAYEYDHGTIVDLEAVAAEGYHFVEWTGDTGTIDDPTVNQTTIEMLDNYTINAEFAINTYMLDISSTEGGDVVGPGEGIFEYDHGTMVDLEAVPEELYHFVEWTGDTETIEDPTENHTTIEMLADSSITAEFALPTHSLTITSTEGGNVIEPGEDVYEYDHGTIVDLEAVAAEGYHFVEWTGDNGTIGDVTANQTTMEMLGDYSITAAFSVDIYELTINVEGEGSTSPEEGTHPYEYGENITVEAFPGENWIFSHWTGDVSEGEEEREIDIFIDGDKEITAHFVRESHFEVEVISPEEGEQYVEGETITVEYRVENLGDVKTTQTIEFFVYDEDGDVVFQDQDEVTLDPVNFTFAGVYEGEFSWKSEEGLTGEFDLSVSSEDEEEIVTVTVLDRYDLTVESEEGGTTNPEPGTYTYTEGERVTIEAVPDEGWQFSHWSGAFESEEEEITITIDGNYTITAHFEELDIWLEIISPEENELFSESEVELEWESGNVEHHEIRLNDEDWIDVGEETVYTFEDLDDGAHAVEVRAAGTGIFVDESINFTVDTIPPELEIISPTADKKISERDVTVEWEGLDDISGIGGYEVRLEDGEWIDVGEDTSYIFEDLEDVEYTVEVRAVDGAGNEANDTVSFNVDLERGDDSAFAGLCSFWWIFLLIPLILIPILFFFWKRREEEEEEPEEEMALSDMEELEGEEESKGEELGGEPTEEPALDESEEGTSEWSEEEKEMEEETPLEETPEVDEGEIEAELDEELRQEEEKVEAGGIGGAAAPSGARETSENECPVCGEKVSEDDEQCPECGTELKRKETEALDDEIFFECDECGFLVTEEEMEECPYCGAELEKDTSSERQNEEE